MPRKSLPEVSWWGDFHLPPQQTRFWQIGPLQLWITRAPREWRIVSRRDEDPLASELIVHQPRHDEPHPDMDRAAAPAGLSDFSFTRFGYRETTDALRLVPAVADRPLVVQVPVPFVLLPGQEVTLYVSSPLWYRVDLGQPAVRAQESPIFRPSDTWFGPDTLGGELCYASRTGARLDLANLPIRPQRAISAVRIRNQAGSSLLLERLKFPTPRLSLFTDSEGHLWTEQLRLDREAEGDDATVRLEKAPPSEIGAATLVCGPRQRATKRFLTRAFGGLFDLGGHEP